MNVQIYPIWIALCEDIQCLKAALCQAVAAAYSWKEILNLLCRRTAEYGYVPIRSIVLFVESSNPYMKDEINYQ